MVILMPRIQVEVHSDRKTFEGAMLLKSNRPWNELAASLESRLLVVPEQTKSKTAHQHEPSRSKTGSEPRY